MNEEQEQGAKIAAARVAAGLSKEAAAKRAGVTTTTWRRAEAGQNVQGHKLASILTAVGIPAFDMSHLGLSEEESEAVAFALPVRIERGYTSTVDFTRAVAEEVPELAQRATRLMLDASSLFADAGNAVFRRDSPQGGDGDADDTRGSAPIVEAAEAAHDEQHTIESEQEADDTP